MCNFVTSFTDLLMYNLIFVGGASLLICLINCILPTKNTKNKNMLFIVPILCFVFATIFLL